MADANIKVTLSVMESCSKSFSKCSDTVLSIAGNLAAASYSMKSAWTDPAQTAFESSFEEMLDEFEKLNSCLLAMSSFSEYVATLYRETDNAAGSLL